MKHTRKKEQDIYVYVKPKAGLSVSAGFSIALAGNGNMSEEMEACFEDL